MYWCKIFSSLAEAEQKINLREPVQLRLGANKRLCLLRTEKGFFAIDNFCPHLGEELHKGRLNDWDEIVCPLHDYRFNLQTGEESSGKNCRDLKTYPIRTDETGFFIGI
jgi:nitrite reductase/ring-hydroxylating ferredoxin subunit